METNLSNLPVALGKKRRGIPRPNVKLVEQFNLLLTKAGRFKMEGLMLARALLTSEALERMERLLFNDQALAALQKKSSRIEFITEGALPPELMDEPASKGQAVYRQVIGYGLCKACRLCIEVCPKHVYKDDGFGRPGVEGRREEECTGPEQCGQCQDVCPENTIHIVMADASLKSTIFVLLPNPYAAAEEKKIAYEAMDFFVPNPLTTDAPLKLATKLDPNNWAESNRVLDDAGFYPILEIRGYPHHFVNSRHPEKDLRLWAGENGHNPGRAAEALRLLYAQLGQLGSLEQGKYRLDIILHRLIDEIIHTGIKLGKNGGLELLARIVREARIEEPFLGAKQRPIGGLLPPGTSLAWKTPYGEQIPHYVHMEKCLGPECGLCVTHCPEGAGGINSATRMVLNVPQGTVASLVRGLKAHLLRLDGSHHSHEDLEDLTGKAPFEFKVDPDYCKACGICITCCPHDVIEPITRVFDLKQ